MPNDLFFSFFNASFLLLFLILFICGHLFLFFFRKKQQKMFASSQALKNLLLPRSFILDTIKISALCIAWTFVVIALMGPVGNFRFSSFKKDKKALSRELILLMDTSASMGVKDTRDQESRLENGKAILQDIVAQSRGINISLYAFTSILTQVVPPTIDSIFLRFAIQNMQLNEGDVQGTDLKNVLESLYNKIGDVSSQKQYIVLLLSDGGEEILLKNPLDIPGVYLYTVGIGSIKPHPVPHVLFEGKQVYSQLNKKPLELLAKEGRGQFYEADLWSSWNLAKAFLENVETLQEYAPPALRNQPVVNWKDPFLSYDLFYQYPLGLALIFYAVFLWIPERKVV